MNTLFVGVFPTGLSYCDRSRDYRKLAFLPFSSLVLEWAPGVRVSPMMRAEIEADAKKMQARRGEAFIVSTCGQTVLLGSTAKEGAS